MKRIPGVIAIQSILYTVPGNVRIRVLNYENRHQMINDDTNNWRAGTIVYDGMASMMGSIRGTMEQYRASRSECHGVKPWVDPDTGEAVLLFKISMTYEQY